MRAMRGHLLLFLAIAGCGSSDPVGEIRRQQADGDFAGSLEPLRELLSERSDDPEVHYLYGRALVGSGHVGSATWSLRRAMEDPDWLLPAGKLLASGALGAGDYRKTIEIAERILSAHPDEVDVLLTRANAFARAPRGQERALADVERILALDPDDARAFEPRIVALVRLERIDEAAAAIEALGERIDRSRMGEGAEAWYCATTALFADDSGEPELARTRWDRCLERHPSHPNVVRGALDFHDARGERDRSLQILREALADEPTSRDYRTRLAQRLRDIGADGEAEALLRDATGSEHLPLASLAWFDLAKHHQEVGDFRAAAEAAGKAVELAGRAGLSEPQLLLEYADSLLLAGEFDRALAVAEEMSLPAHREVIRARVAQERGRPAEALRHFDEAFLLWPDNPWARYYAARAAEKVGDFDRAVEEYRYSIRIDSGATDARIRVARLHLAEGRALEALNLLRVRAHSAPLGPDGEILSLHLWARLGRTVDVRGGLEAFRLGAPELLGRAVASVAQGVRERSGPDTALGVLLEWESAGLDLRDPRHADALRAIVRFAHEAGRSEEALADVRAAVAAHADAAAFHEILGLWLELRRAPVAEVREAYARALELAPENARALVGLGRMVRELDPDRALALFERAAVADPGAAEPRREAAAVLVANGRAEEAEEHLDALLDEHPYDGEAAAQLAELLLARGSGSERTLELARRAERFGGGADGVERLGRALDQP